MSIQSETSHMIIHSHKHTHTQSHMHACMHAHIQTAAHMHARTHTHTNMHACTHACMRTHYQLDKTCLVKSSIVPHLKNIYIKNWIGISETKSMIQSLVSDFFSPAQNLIFRWHCMIDGMLQSKNWLANKLDKTCFEKIQAHERFKITLFIKTKQNAWIFRVIPLIKLQNDT